MNDLPVNVPGTKADTLMWAYEQEVDQLALQQIRNVSTLPWVHGVRIMPDVHGGYGVPIGSVVAMRQAVSPSACGVDLGCGMEALQTSLRLSDLPESLHDVRTAIESAVPVGRQAFESRAPILGEMRTSSLTRGVDQLFARFSDLRADVQDRQKRAASQCGTLGGGNHFIELCADEQDRIWVTLHSGSRNIGKEIADWHIAKAKVLDHNQQIADPDLAVFLAGTDLMDDYLHDMYWAQTYAALNRQVMMRTVHQALLTVLPSFSQDNYVSCHHNYISEEVYDGIPLTITRKGAIFAGRDRLGVIPGSMGTGSYIVRGLGNNMSYQSASHGAGRRMSRGQAKRQFTVADLEQQTAGIECRKDAGVLDEIPGAYKDIEQVINNQADLVSVEARLHTLLCVKG